MTGSDDLWLQMCSEKQRVAWCAVEKQIRAKPGIPLSHVLKKLRISPCTYYAAKRKKEWHDSTNISPPTFSESRDEVQPTTLAGSVTTTMISAHKEHLTYQEKLNLFDAVQVQKEEQGFASDSEACRALGVDYKIFLEIKNAVEAELAKEVEEKRRECKSPKTIEWEQQIRTGMREGIESVAREMQKSLVQLGVLTELSEKMKTLTAIIQLLEPLSGNDREAVIRAAGAYYWFGTGDAV